MVIEKLFSDRVWEKYRHIIIGNIGEILGLNKATIIQYKVGPNWAKDVSSLEASLM